MAYTAITKAVANVVMDAKLSVIDDLITFLESKIDVDDDLKGMFDEFKSNLKDSEEKVVKAAGKKISKGKGDKSESVEPKKKRAPSVFNLYVKDVMPDMKAKHPDVKDGKQMITFASSSWKTDPMAHFIKEKVIEMKNDDKKGDVVEMYARAKALFKGEAVPEKNVVSDDENESDEENEKEKENEKENESDEENEKEKEKENESEKEKESDEEKENESEKEKEHESDEENEKPLKKTSHKKNKGAKKEKASKKSVAKKHNVVKEKENEYESDDE
jgi:cobalamin biosynthesis protein CobT